MHDRRYRTWNAPGTIVGGQGGAALLEGLTERDWGESCASSVQAEDSLLTGKRPSPQLRIELRIEEPRWLRPTVQRMEQLLALPRNWDSYGALPVTVVSVQMALNALMMVMESRSPAPTVVPTVEGGVQLEWHQNDIDLEVEVKPEGQILMSRQGGLLPEASEVGLAHDCNILIQTIRHL